MLNNSSKIKIMSFRTFDAKKFSALLEQRNRSYLINKSNNAFSNSNLTHWSQGLHTPKAASVSALLKALGCEWEDISSEYREAASSPV